MNSFSLRITFHDNTMVFPLQVCPDAVWSQATGSLDGLMLDRKSAIALENFVGSVNAEVPLYCYHEGMQTSDTYSIEINDREYAAVGKWEIGLNGSYDVSYDEIQAAITES